MKTPVSILCISDLHLRHRELDSITHLGRDLLDYARNNQNNQAMCWIPDYIVIAGDIVNRGEQNYESARTHINDLLDLFKISPNHVIMVPGNHDNNVKRYNFKNYKEECQIFEDYQNNVLGNKGQFWDHFSNKFEDYISFCHSFIEGNEGNSYYSAGDLFPSNSNAQELGLLSGVRFFEDDSLCFLYVNTEWLYVEPKKLINRRTAKKKQYLSIKEQCKLCAPIIYDAFQLIRKSCPRATVITVMHRYFNDLNILEYNNTDKARMDSVHMIEEISDLILTGHEHRVSIEPPSFMNNRYQHISIGAAGIESINKQIPVRTACVININPAQKVLKMLNATYDEKDGIWSFSEDRNSYPMHPINDDKEMVNNNGRIPCIKAKNFDNDAIDNAIKDYFVIEDDSPVKYVPIKYLYDIKALENELDDVINKHSSKELLFIVVYRVIVEGSDDGNKGDVEEFTDFYKENHLVDIVDNVIVKGVYVLVPRQINVDYE